MAEDPRKEESRIAQNGDAMRRAGPYLNAVSELIGGAVAGMLLSWAAVKYLHAPQWASLLIILVCIGAGFYGFIRTTTKLGKKK